MMPRAYYFEHRIFQGALALSIGVHALLVVQLSRIKAIEKFQSIKPVEIIYQGVLPEKKFSNPNKSAVRPADQKSLPELPDLKSVTVSSGRNPALVKDTAKRTYEPERVSEKSKGAQLVQVSVDKKIDLSDLPPALANSPTYQDYREVIQQKISARLDQNVDWTRKNKGHVYVSFVLTNNGELIRFNIVEDKTAADFHLRDLIWKSVREASPFKPFPKDWGFSQVPFGVMITFRGDDHGLKAQ